MFEICETYIDINISVSSFFQTPKAEQIGELHSAVSVKQ